MCQSEFSNGKKLYSVQGAFRPRTFYIFADFFNSAIASPYVLYVYVFMRLSNQIRYLLQFRAHPATETLNKTWDKQEPKQEMIVNAECFQHNHSQLLSPRTHPAFPNTILSKRPWIPVLEELSSVCLVFCFMFLFKPQRSVQWSHTLHIWKLFQNWYHTIGNSD